MSYRSEFPSDFTVSPGVLNQVRYRTLVDVSWHNDVSPSFWCERTLRRLWVDHPVPDMREWPETPRYLVLHTDEDGTDDYSLPPIYEGDDEHLALCAVLDRPIPRRPGAARRTPPP